MYAAYTINQDINTVAYKSEILSIKKTLRNIIKINKNGLLGECRCNVVTCILKKSQQECFKENTAQSFQVETRKDKTGYVLSSITSS